MRFENSTILSAPRETVWGLVADTDPLNREMGLPPIPFRFVPRTDGGADTFAEIRVAGLTLRYREHPFDWVRPCYYRVRRTFAGGPIREIVGGATLEAVEGGTRVVVWSEIEPSGPLGAVACRAVGTKANADFLRACRGFEEFLKGRAPTPYPRHTSEPPPNRVRLDQKLRSLADAGGERHLVERLGAFLADSPPESTMGMRPFALADAWGVDRFAALKTFLLAASGSVGLLELRWRVLCPVCRGGPSAASHLSQVSSQVHCESCNIRFDSEFDRSVEVCFDVAPAVRPVKEVTHCIGGPGRAPHTAAQFYLRAGERRTDEIRLPPGEYNLTSAQSVSSCRFCVQERSASTIQCTIQERAGRIGMELATDGPVNPDACWILQNMTDRAVVLRLETPEWTGEAATAALVTSLQAFRDQFGSEVLSPGTEAAIRQICVLFSDLRGSTSMYRTHGDAPSYKTVRTHFELMRRIIDTHNGAIVKTIGDAVMATFVDPADGVKAALAVQRETSSMPDHPVVKLGLHYGPAIAVTANERLDYFGQTINLASRIQAQSEGGDVVLSAALAGDGGVSGLLSTLRLEPEPFEAAVRGLEEPVRMVRIRAGAASGTRGAAAGVIPG